MCYLHTHHHQPVPQTENQYLTPLPKVPSDTTNGTGTTTSSIGSLTPFYQQASIHPALVQRQEPTQQTACSLHKILGECGKVYIWETGCKPNTRLQENRTCQGINDWDRSHIVGSTRANTGVLGGSEKPSQYTLTIPDFSSTSRSFSSTKKTQSPLLEHQRQYRPQSAAGYPPVTYHTAHCPARPTNSSSQLRHKPTQHSSAASRHKNFLPQLTPEHMDQRWKDSTINSKQ